jgi:hypothetical protein
MTDGPETVDKWVIEVANHAGRLHLVRSKSLLRVVFSKYYFYSKIIFFCNLY